MMDEDASRCGVSNGKIIRTSIKARDHDRCLKNVMLSMPNMKWQKASSLSVEFKKYLRGVECFQGSGGY